MRLILKVFLCPIAIAAVAAILVAPTYAAPQTNCESKLQMQAQGQPEPKDWDGLYRIFKQFGACDDGSIGERFSADVAQLFTKQWAHLDTLSRLAGADNAFERFVLRHIDTSLDEDDLLHIADNSKFHCPAKEKRICSLVHAQAQDTLDKLRDASE